LVEVIASIDYDGEILRGERHGQAMRELGPTYAAGQCHHSQSPTPSRTYASQAGRAFIVAAVGAAA
jgi:hypothetical protein